MEVCMKRDLPPLGSPYLTAAEAARYLRYRSASGVRSAVSRGELRPAGAGPRNTLLFTIAELDRFIAARLVRYRQCRGVEVPSHAEMTAAGQRAPARRPLVAEGSHEAEGWGIRGIVEALQNLE